MKERTLKKGLLKWPLMALTCIAALGSTAQAQTNGCVYYSRTNGASGGGTLTQLFKVMNPGTSNVSMVAIGSPVNFSYNGIGYYNGDLYAVTSWDGRIVKINTTTGVVTNLGVSLPFGNNYASGEVANGIYYTTNMNGGQHALYKVNLTTLSVSSLNLPTQFADFAFYNGYLYGATGGGTIYRIDPNTAAVTSLGSGVIGGNAAIYSDGTGMIYFNEGGTLNVNTGVITTNTTVGTNGQSGAVQGSNDEDATFCPTCVCNTPSTTTLSGKLFNDPAGNHTGTTGTNGGGLYASLINNSGVVVATVPLNADGTYSFSNVAPGTYSVALTTSASGSTTPSLNPGWVITGEGYQVWDPVEDGKINNITVGSSPVTAVNFMAERLPTAGSSTVNTTNPGGTGTINITPNFTGTDPDGTVTQIHFTTFPTNTTSITIGGTTYTAANWPATGVTVPTGTTVLLDPVDGTSAPVVPYKVIDNAGKESTNPGSVTVNLTAPVTYPVSGNIFDDGNGGTIDGTGTNAGGTLYVVLTNGSGTIVGSSPVAANGTYSINAPAGTYSAILTTSSTSTTPVLPTGWANTNEGLTAAGDGTVNGTIPNINVTASVNGANFGIDQLPTAGTSSTTATNPGGTGTINITPNFTGTDPDGTVTQIHFTTFPTNTTSITIGGTTYTAANWPATGVTVPTGTAVLLDPTGTGNPVVPYKVIDNAGKESTNPGSVTVNLTAPVTYPVSGNIFDDGNGGTIDGTGTNAGGTLYVVLTNGSGTIVGSSPVAANGTYSINAPAGTYSAILTTSPTSTTPALPTGWANTNEGLTAAGDGTVNGTIPNINVSGSVNGANFGIDQLPTAGTSSTTATNPGGTGTIDITPNFTGTDPDGTVTQIHFTTFPTNTSSIIIGGTVYTAANWPAAGVTVPTGTTILLDPVDGTSAPVVPYKVIDNAGKESTNPGSVTVNLTAPVTYTVSGNVYDDGNGGTIDGIGTNLNGTLYVVLTNASGTIVGSSPVAANGTYSINAPAGTYSAILTTSPTSTTPAFPSSGFANTNEGLTAAGDGTANGIIPAINVSSNVSGANFGFDELPTAGTSNPTMANPGGTNTLNITNQFTGTDPDGTVTQIHFTTFPVNTTSITIGGTTYTAANWPAAGVTVPTGTTVMLDPTGTGNPVATYKVIDNAGKESLNPGSVTVYLTAPATYPVSGNVFDDGNGGTIDGVGTNLGGNLYVVLIDASGTIVGSSPMTNNGYYIIYAPAGTYSAILTTSPTSTTPALPTGWANTNEGLTAAGDGTVNGMIPAINVTGSVNGANFGIDQLPTAGTSSTTATNPGGTGTINITPNFTGTDPDGTVTQIHFTTFPTNTTSITIGGTTYTAANWPATGVTVPTGTAVLLDPTGTGNPVAPYKVIDNAGKESTNPGSVTVNLTAPGATPDLTPSLDIDNLSFPVAGAPRDFVVNVFEINGGTAVNPITIRLAKLSAFTITYPTESSTSNVYGGIANENSNWDFTENGSFITITAKAGVTIPANGSAVLGFTIARKPGVINGTTQNLTTTIIGGSGGETNTTNNKTLTSFTASPN